MDDMDLGKELDRVGRFVRRNFSSALMSDTKWRKMFVALDTANIGLEQVVVKFVEVEKVHRLRIPTKADLHPPWPWVDTLEFGPIELRAIEWLEFPRTAEWPRRNGVPDLHVAQDIQAARAIIEALGLYPVEAIGASLRINGYAR